MEIHPDDLYDPVIDEDEEDDFEFDNPYGLNMNKIMPNLYIGDYLASQNFNALREMGIRHIISAMRQKYTTPPDFTLHRVLVEDTDRTNMLVHFETCNDLIRNALLAGEGVLVHCQAGVSRSTTLCAAFLMSEFGLTVEEAIARIAGVRSQVRPTQFFLHQLEMYERMNYEVDPAKYPEYRRFLMNFNHVDIMDGDGSVDQLYLAYFPSPAPTPRDRSMSDPFRSLRMTSLDGTPLSRRSSNASAHSAASRRSSAASSRRPSRSEMWSMTAMTPTEATTPDSGPQPQPQPQRTASKRRLPSGLTPVVASSVSDTSPVLSPDSPSITASPDPVSPSTSQVGAASNAAVNASAALRDNIRKMLHNHAAAASSSKGKAVSDQEKQQREKELLKMETLKLIEGKEKLLTVGKGRVVVQGRRLRCKMCRRELAAREHIVEHEPGEGQAAFAPRRRDMVQHRLDLERRRAEALKVSRQKLEAAEAEATSESKSESESAETTTNKTTPLAERRGTDLNLKLNVPSGLYDDSAIEDDEEEEPANNRDGPLLHSATCSSYFVEPLSWMSDQLGEGQIGGKITCPNKKCGAKLGSFDWAGLQCSCGAWIVPAFQLAASKVDEVV